MIPEQKALAYLQRLTFVGANLPSSKIWVLSVPVILLLPREVQNAWDILRENSVVGASVSLASSFSNSPSWVGVCLFLRN